jgi:hypothetical protein
VLLSVTSAFVVWLSSYDAEAMDRALGLRRRDWLARTPCGSIIDNRIKLPGDLCLEIPQNAGGLFDVDCGQLDLALRRLEFLKDFGDQIPSPLGAAVP